MKITEFVKDTTGTIVGFKVVASCVGECVIAYDRGKWLSYNLTRIYLGREDIRRTMVASGLRVIDGAFGGKVLLEGDGRIRAITGKNIIDLESYHIGLQKYFKENYNLYKLSISV